MYIHECARCQTGSSEQKRVCILTFFFFFLTVPCSASFQTGWAVWQHWRTCSCWLCHSGRDRTWLLLLSAGRDSIGPLYTAVAQLWPEDAWSRDAGEILYVNMASVQDILLIRYSQMLTFQCNRISFTYSRVCSALGIRSASANSDLTTASSPCSQCTVAFRTKAHHRLTGSPTGGEKKTSLEFQWGVDVAFESEMMLRQWHQFKLCVMI